MIVIILLLHFNRCYWIWINLKGQQFGNTVDHLSQYQELMKRQLSCFMNCFHTKKRIYSLLGAHLIKQMGWKHSDSKERWKTLFNQSNIPMMKQKQRAMYSYKHHSFPFWKPSMVPLPTNNKSSDTMVLSLKTLDALWNQEKCWCFGQTKKLAKVHIRTVESLSRITFRLFNGLQILKFTYRSRVQQAFTTCDTTSQTP